VEVQPNINLHRPEALVRSSALPTGVDSVLREIAVQLDRLAQLHFELHAQPETGQSDLQAHSKASIEQFLQSLLEGLDSTRQQTEQALSSLGKIEPRQAALSAALGHQISGLMETKTHVVDAQIRFATALQQLNAQTEKELTLARTADALVHDSIRFDESAKFLQELVGGWQSCVERSTPLLDAIHGDSQKAGGSINQLRQMITSTVSVLADEENSLSRLQNQMNSISSAVSVIDDIAEMTHLLALNASIEAVRAGEQGKGFSVVAEDIRKLSERSSAAARDVFQKMSSVSNHGRSSIDSIQLSKKRIESALALADDADAHLMHVRDAFAKISQLQIGMGDQLREGQSACHATLSQCRVLGKNARAVKETAQTFFDSHRGEKRNLNSLLQILHRIERNVQTELEQAERSFVEQQKCEHETFTVSERLLIATSHLTSAKAETDAAIQTFNNSQYLSRIEKNTPNIYSIEISEQLKQCAQEILNLVDTPRDERRAS
jgi:methyl-accepting chemotaxis protein